MTDQMSVMWPWCLWPEPPHSDKTGSLARPTPSGDKVGLITHIAVMLGDRGAKDR